VIAKSQKNILCAYGNEYWTLKDQQDKKGRSNTNIRILGVTEIYE